MSRRLAAVACLAGAALLLAGCGPLFGEVAPRDAPLPQAVPEPEVGGAPLVTDCQPPFAFEGQATLAEFGVANDVGTGEQRARRGTVRITRDFVTHAEFAPPGASDAPPGGGQMLCITWPDGTSMATLLSEPFAGAGPDQPDAVSDGEDGGGPPAGMLVALAVAVVVGVSWLAFRRKPAGS